MELNLIVMCGLQCSGKSTKAKALSTKYNARIVSSDDLRLKYPDLDGWGIFCKVYGLMNYYLKNNQSVIIDATNVTGKARRKYIKKLEVDCNKICYVVNTPYEKCIERLSIRNASDYPHKFGEDVIENFHKRFKMPTYDEGWNEIIIDNN